MEAYGKKRKKSICTICLVTANVAIFLVLSFFGMTEDGQFMLEHGAMYVPYVLEQGEYYRMFTSMFLHFGFEHLMNNMIMLAAIGWNLEVAVGRIRFLIIYVVSGLGGAVLSMWWDIRSMDYPVSAGASGAIFGLIGAAVYVAMRNRGQIGNVSGRGLVFMAVLSLYFGYTNSSVDNFAHVGGLAAGFLLAVLLYRKGKSKDRLYAGF